MSALHAVLILLGLAGWVTAWIVFARRTRPVEFTPPAETPAPSDTPQYAVLVNRAGTPESLRALRGAAPQAYSRPHGRGAASVYVRTGLAVVYRAES